MENAAEPRPAESSSAPADEEPEPARERSVRAAIEAHHFQRPTVSPVGSGERTARGG
jgi:hypothetical protein